jgi:hypothetical protein
MSFYFAARMPPGTEPGRLAALRRTAPPADEAATASAAVDGAPPAATQEEADEKQEGDGAKVGS